MQKPPEAIARAKYGDSAATRRSLLMGRDEDAQTRGIHERDPTDVDDEMGHVHEKDRTLNSLEDLPPDGEIDLAAKPHHSAVTCTSDGWL